MSVAYKRGSTTGPSDLSITIRDSIGNLIDPYRLQYAVYDNTTGIEVLIGSPINTPIRISAGQYYAQVVVAADANVGDWLIRWTIQETSVDPVYQSVQEFNVVGDSTIVSVTGDINFDKLVFSLRILLRDNNPDRNYRTRPPASEKFIQGQTQVFGFIWEDEELVEYIYDAVDDFNSRPPVTGITVPDLWGTMRRWRTAILLRAGAFACFAIAMNWIADEFSIDEKEMLRLRIDGDPDDIYVPIGLLYSIVYEDSIEEGKQAAIKGMAELGIQVVTGKDILMNGYDTDRLRDAYQMGELLTQSMDEKGKTSWAPIMEVSRHECPDKKILKITTDRGSVIVTEDHSLFSWATKGPVTGKDLYPGYSIVGESEGEICPILVIKVGELEGRQYMYDLSVPGDENFFLASGILAHNSYSISGVSLDIEKSSKYQSMKDEFIAEWDKAVEAAKRSIKIIKGLRQFRYGVGITSAMGPLSRPGVQSRRNFIESGSVGTWS